jgi:hypothetical protein
MQKEIRTYAELEKQMRDALREQHPDWVDPNGDCPRAVSTKSGSPNSSPCVRK